MMTNNTLTLKTSPKIKAFITGLYEESLEGFLIVPENDPLNEIIQKLLFKSISKSDKTDWIESTLLLPFSIPEGYSLRDISHKLINSALDYRLKETLTSFLRQGAVNKQRQIDLIQFFIEKYNLQGIVTPGTLKRAYHRHIEDNTNK